MLLDVDQCFALAIDKECLQHCKSLMIGLSSFKNRIVAENSNHFMSAKGKRVYNRASNTPKRHITCLPLLMGNDLFGQHNVKHVTLCRLYLL